MHTVRPAVTPARWQQAFDVVAGALNDADMEPVIEDLHEHLRRTSVGGLIAVALTGSSADGGLGPDSDLDLLMVTERSLSQQERRALVDHLLAVSGARATRRPGRPVELASLRLDDVVPWRYPATCDFLYGEWLRPAYLGGRLPERTTDSNLPVLITSARQRAICLSGPTMRDLLEPVPATDLYQSLQDGLPSLMENLVGDERNVLLTLARMITTLETGRIVPKDQAAAQVLPTLPTNCRKVLSLAAAAYRGHLPDDWPTMRREAEQTAELLAARVRSRAPHSRSSDSSRDDDPRGARR